MKEVFRRMWRHPDFSDCRGMKVILVPHCVLNQNARSAGAAESPAAVTQLIAGLMDRGIGIVQMPCPELQVIGLDRKNIEIRSELKKTGGQIQCRRIAEELIHQIQEYRKYGVTVLGILGKNGSPSCSVEETWHDGVVPGEGAFIKQLKEELRDRHMSTKMAGIRDEDPAAALRVVDLWLTC
jgi:predicted secreted protein